MSPFNKNMEKSHNYHNNTVERIPIETIIHHVLSLQYQGNQEMEDIEDMEVFSEELRKLDSGDIKSITNFPESIKQFFDGCDLDTVCRYGVKSKYPHGSFYMSFIMAITAGYEEFNQMSQADKQNYMTKFVKKLYSDANQFYVKQDNNKLTLSEKNLIHKIDMANNKDKKDKKDKDPVKEDKEDDQVKQLEQEVEEKVNQPNYSHQLPYYKDIGIKKLDLVTNLKKYEDSNIIMRYLSDYFTINLFVIELDNKTVNVCYGEDVFDKHKMNMVLCVLDDHYEPIMFDGKGLIDSSNRFIQNIANSTNIVKLLHSFPKDDRDFRIVKEERVDMSDLLDSDKDKQEDSKLDEESDKERSSSDKEDNMYSDDNSTDEDMSDHEINTETAQVPEVTLKMTLKQLQEVAKIKGITLYSGTTKSGKPKAKTKSVLFEEISG